MAGSIGAAAPASLPLDKMARRLQYQLDVDYDGLVTNQDAAGTGGAPEAAAIVALSGNQRLDLPGLMTWVGKYDTHNAQTGANTADGQIDDLEFSRLVTDVTHMVEHQDPSLSVPIADLSASLVQQLDQDGNHVLNNVDAALQPAVRGLLTLAHATTLNAASMATLLKKYDTFDAANNRAGADTKIGPSEFQQFAADVQANSPHPATPTPPGTPGTGTGAAAGAVTGATRAVGR